jgi:hypothetical protein
MAGALNFSEARRRTPSEDIALDLAVQIDRMRRAASCQTSVKNVTVLQVRARSLGANLGLR